MKILLKWINEYVKIDDFSLEEIENALVEIGFEVESCGYLGESVCRVKTCKVGSVQKISEKLKYCSIDFGEREKINVVCGAANVREGMITAYASVGAKIKGETIQIADFGEFKSNGMLCSASELGLSGDYFDFPVALDGILDFPPETKVGEDLAQILFLDDYILDVSITANRPDCQSIYGLARELSVKFGRKLNPLPTEYKKTVYNGEYMPKITIMDKDLCSLYMGSRIKNTNVANSPDWMRARLIALGHKPINNVVDITNYVLIEVGQPLHAFDMSEIDNEIIVRQSARGERITTLDGVNRSLNGSLVIADAQKPLAIAGIMGGEFSGIKSSTTDVLLESARFARGHIRLGSRSLGIFTDSSKRYEKGVDFYSVEAGRKRALSLVDQLGVGEIVDVVAQDCDKKVIDESENREILLDLSQIESILGIKVPVLFVENTLSALGFGVKKEKSGFRVAIPLFREDIDNFADLVEEVIRFYGYDKLVAQPVESLLMTRGGISDERAVVNRIERICTAFGMLQVKNFSFIPPTEYKKLLINRIEQIKISNPLSEEYSAMRTQLLSGVLNTAALNLNRKNQDFRIFELDNVFLPQDNGQLPVEKMMLCAVFCSASDDFYSVKSFINALCAEFKLKYQIEKTDEPYFHPNLSADIFVGRQKLASFGRVHPLVSKSFEIERDVYAIEVDVNLLTAYAKKSIKFEPLPKYPSVERDLAIVIDKNVTVGQIFDAIEEGCAKMSSSLVCVTELIEVYCGEQVESGKKSVLVRLHLTNKEKTMTENEISAITANAIEQLEQKFKAKLRK